MAFVAAPNIVQVEWRYLYEGQKCENRINVDNFGPPGVSDLNVLATAAWNWWENVYSLKINEAVTLASVVCTDMGLQNGSQVVYAPDTTTKGQVLGAVLPNETSFCISLHTDSRGRSARGRWFVAGVTDAYRATPNTLNVIDAEALRAALQNYINTTIEGARATVIVSRFANGAPRAGGPVYFPITAAAVTDLILDSQRRRKPGFGA